MPTYEYVCKSCGTHTEAVQSFTDDALTECPTCGGQLRKVFGNIGISFKGSGFYKNDSRGSSSSSSTSTKTTEGSKADSSTTSTDKPKSDSGSTTTKTETTSTPSPSTSN